MAKSYLPANYTDAEIGAIQALNEGIANEGQQQRALKWIIEEVCAYYDLSYNPGDGGRRDTDFSEGKRYCGAQIVKMLKLKVGDKRESE